ncbi:MAG: hypothetical protein MASP_01199 [Candidatus Methanolliviera sp. GoM_asphalt]|nr:MAG: hypothetical protein MASP_01199 [Candidatus Methanolliviera sp. GoM_asphalt]
MLSMISPITSSLSFSSLTEMYPSEAFFIASFIFSACSWRYLLFSIICASFSFNSDISVATIIPPSIEGMNASDTKTGTSLPSLALKAYSNSIISPLCAFSIFSSAIFSISIIRSGMRIGSSLISLFNNSSPS